MATYGDAPPAVSSDAKKKNNSKKTPQETLSEFWDKFHTKYPGKVTSIFPRSLYSNVLSYPRGVRSARNAGESYEAAARECRDKIRRIVRECQRTNEKFTDPDFDIEYDFHRNCLHGLIRDEDGGGDSAGTRPAVSAWEVKNSLNTLAQSQMLGPGGVVSVDAGALGQFIGAGDYERYTDRHASGDEWYDPGSVHRVDWIFESPQFTVSGYSSSDIKQGANGDCWWLAATATIAHRKDLMDRMCVARDEECGVYGFVFQRDGEWTSVVIDDNLYLKAPDFDYYGDVYDSTGKRARQHRKRKQTGSEALYFARCEDANETWLPLLEKAYSKIHGDFEAVSGGFPGEAVEDMTGGVTTTIAGNRVLSKDKLWKELVNSNGDFVFALAAFGTGWDWQKSGLALNHAYSILQSREEVDEDGKKFRLVQIRNPWGERDGTGAGEWNGPWSDGSKEWTSYWLKKLDHKFGDDGAFWMSYQDMLDTFMFIYRTRLFDEKWTVVQQWTSANVSWITGYLQTKFLIEIKKSGMVVIVLTQLDTRYFIGFEGEYHFELHFILQQVDSAPDDHICRVRPVHKWENRSVSCEVELEPGLYEVLPKVTATRKWGGKPVEDVVKRYADKNPQKLRQVGMQYDLAHAKGGVPDEDDALLQRRLLEKKKEEDRRRRARERRKRAMAEAARAMKRAAEAMDQAAGAEAEAEGKKEKEKEKENESTGATATTAVDASAVKDTEKPPVDESKQGLSSSPAGHGGSSSSSSTATTATIASDKNTQTPKSLKDDSIPPKDAPASPPPPPPPADSNETEQAETAETEEVFADEGGEDEASELETDMSDSDKDNDDDDDSADVTPWNAVAVIGLRVYARDPDVSITLTQAAAPSEATALTVDGKPAGATM